MADILARLAQKADSLSALQLTGALWYSLSNTPTPPHSSPAPSLRPSPPLFLDRSAAPGQSSVCMEISCSLANASYLRTHRDKLTRTCSSRCVMHEDISNVLHLECFTTKLLAKRQTIFSQIQYVIRYVYEFRYLFHNKTITIRDGPSDLLVTKKIVQGKIVRKKSCKSTTRHVEVQHWPKSMLQPQSY